MGCYRRQSLQFTSSSAGGDRKIFLWVPQVTDYEHPTLSKSLVNFRKNIVVVMALIGLLIANFAIKGPHNEMLWTVVIVLVIKAESRPQPTTVLILSVAVAISTITATLDFRGLGAYSEWMTVLLVIPLVLSKWLFPVGLDT
jgi:hypothetical protein